VKYEDKLISLRSLAAMGPNSFSELAMSLLICTTTNIEVDYCPMGPKKYLSSLKQL
jgi:hypothetical protein